MHYKLALIVVTGLLPFATLGETTNLESSSSSPATGVLRLKVICQNGEVVTLDDATLVEHSVQKAGTMPPPTEGTNTPAVRLQMLDGGTVSIPWDTIEKITVGERHSSENIYPIEVTLKDNKETKVGKTYGVKNAIVGQSADGEFSVQLKDVKEIIVLPPPESQL